MNDRALKVLEQYDLEVTGTRRGRGSWLLETPQGLRILSDYSGTENKALFQNSVMQKIREGGYARVDVILPNREGALVSRDWEGSQYVLKEWYAGRECDTNSESEILAAVANLARLHGMMKLDNEPEFQESFSEPSPAAELQAQNAELRRVRAFIRKRNNKNGFEQLFLQCYEHYYEQARQAEAVLFGIQDRLTKLCGENNGAVCHGDYSHHHILMSGYEIATTNFEHCRFGFQVSDLYRFMRKIMEKHDWNSRLGMRMLECYHQIRHLSFAERRLLCVRMLYPEKFRKLANYYYGSSKAWISRQYGEKLEKLNRQDAARLAFVARLER